MSEPDKPKKIRSADFQRLYSNSAELRFSNWDVALLFGQIHPEGDDPVIEEQLEIIMSLQHAKVFAGLLSRSIQQFEKQFGEIQMFSVSETKSVGDPEEKAGTPKDKAIASSKTR